MRAHCIVRHGEPLEALDRPIPEPVGTEVLVRVTAAGLCHTDLHIWEGSYDLGGGKRLTLAERGIHLPITPSHEICGEIVAAGSLADVRRGLRCLVHPWIGCGACAACQRGEENICIKPQSLGIVRPGGFGEYVLVPDPRYLIDIEDLDAAQAAPLACAGLTTFSALKKFGARIHEAPLVVIGAGGLGLSAISILRALGGIGAIVVDVDARKREAALTAGALLAIDGNAADAAQQIAKSTDGGARAILDLVGATATQTLALASIARGAHIVICGLMGGNITIPLPFIPMRPITIQGSYVGTLDELRALVELAKRSKAAIIPVTRRPLSEANDALRDLRDGKVIGRIVLVH
ncbi:MAG: zinc-binding dehydrogenase [Betaproteobacteria bacterium]|nr:MAG: zinc-binding dehydrogenase [Betaproteobacteria bacterium]